MTTEERVRAAVRARAEAVQPSADGWARIEAGIAARPASRRRYVVPAALIATATAAAVTFVLVAGPGDDPVHVVTPVTTPSTTTPSTTTTTVPPTTRPAPPTTIAPIIVRGTPYEGSADCDAPVLEPRYIPDGFRPVRERPEAKYDWVATWRNGDRRIRVYGDLSADFGDDPGTRVSVRGHRATLNGTGDGYAVMWDESVPCNVQYAVSGDDEETVVRVAQSLER